MTERRGRGNYRGRGQSRGRGGGHRGFISGDKRTSAESASATPQPPKPPRVPKPPYDGPTYNWRTMCPGAELLYLRSHEDADRAISALVALNPAAVGFDLEWRPSTQRNQPENPVALIQLSSDKLIMLFQVSAMGEFPQSLRTFLSSPICIKTGVAIQSDCGKLHRDWKVDVSNCVDLGLLARSADPRWTGKYNKPLGLCHLAEVYLGHTLPKGRVQRSDWEAILSEEQKNYAANDAQCGFMIYKKLAEKVLEMTPIPDPDCYTFNMENGCLRDYEHRPWFPFNPNYDPGPPEPVQLNAAVGEAILNG